MRKLCVALLAGVCLAGSAEAARYYEFRITGDTPFVYQDFGSIYPQSYIVTNSIDAVFDTTQQVVSIGYVAAGSNGDASVGFSTFNQTLFTYGSGAGEQFSLKLDLLSVPLSDTLQSINASGTFGYGYCKGTCITSPGYLTSVLGRTTDIAPSGVGIATQTTLLTAVPEPASWGMMLAGFGAIGGAMRRRVRTASRVSAA